MLLVFIGFNILFSCKKIESLSDALDDCIPPECDADQTNDAYPYKGLCGVCLGTVPVSNFFKHK